MRDYIVGGVPLRDPLGQWFIDYTRTGPLTELSRTLSGDPPYGYHGDAVSRIGFFGTGRESIVLNVIGTSKDDYNAIARGLSALFQRQEYSVVAAPQRSALAGGTARQGQTFNVSVDLQRQGTFRTVGSIAVERIDEQTARWTIIIENRLAFWMSTQLYTSLPYVLSAASGTMDLKPTLADSGAPITDGLIRIKGPIGIGGNVMVRDRTEATAVKYTATVALAATEYVVIDMATLSARLQTSNVWTLTTGTDVSSRLDKTGEGPMTLTPGDVVAFPTSYDYNATVTSSGYTSGSTAVEVRARRSYLA